MQNGSVLARPSGVGGIDDVADGRELIARLPGWAASRNRGVSHSRRIRTIRPDVKTGRLAGLVGRDITADAPSRIWVTDLILPWPGVVGGVLAVGDR